jgi:hypothetical protein
MLSLERDKPVQPTASASPPRSEEKKLRALDIFFFPLLSAIVRAAPASNQAALVDDRPLQCHSYAAVSAHSRRQLPKMRSRTLDLLTLLVAHVPCDFHRITHKPIAARMVYRAFHSRFVLDHVDCKACAFCEGAELVVDGLHLDRVERNERRLACALISHVLNVWCAFSSQRAKKLSE